MAKFWKLWRFKAVSESLLMVSCSDTIGIAAIFVKARMVNMLTLDPNEVYSLSDFQRNAKRHISRMKKKRHPLVLTFNGKAEVVALDVALFQQILEALDRAEAIEGIRRGLEDVKQGRTMPLEEFARKMEERFDIPRKR
jgi:PHD/YefM family antitoxin component YafN of YafNO toxin-antitoxin module